MIDIVGVLVGFVVVAFQQKIHTREDMDLLKSGIFKVR